VQRVRPVAATWGESRGDWTIVNDIALRLGAGWTHTAPDAIMADIAESVPGYESLTYASLEAAGQRRTVIGEPGVQAALSVPSTAKLPDASSGPQAAFKLITGSVREHHGTGVRSSRSEGLIRLVPDAQARLSPADAERLGLAEGDTVSVGAGGEKKIALPVKITSSVPEGVVFVPGFSAAAPVTRLLERGSAGAATVSVERV